MQSGFGVYVLAKKTSLQGNSSGCLGVFKPTQTRDKEMGAHRGKEGFPELPVVICCVS